MNEKPCLPGNCCKQFEHTIHDFITYICAGEDSLVLLDKTGKMCALKEGSYFQRLDIADQITNSFCLSGCAMGYSQSTNCLYQWNINSDYATSPYTIKIESAYLNGLMVCDSTSSTNMVSIGYNPVQKESNIKKKISEFLSKTPNKINITKEAQKQFVNNVALLRNRLNSINKKWNSCKKTPETRCVSQNKEYSTIKLMRCPSAFNINITENKRLYDKVNQIIHSVLHKALKHIKKTATQRMNITSKEITSFQSKLKIKLLKSAFKTFANYHNKYKRSRHLLSVLSKISIKSLAHAINKWKFVCKEYRNIIKFINSVNKVVIDNLPIKELQDYSKYAKLNQMFIDANKKNRITTMVNIISKTTLHKSFEKLKINNRVHTYFNSNKCRSKGNYKYNSDKKTMYSSCSSFTPLLEAKQTFPILLKESIIIIGNRQPKLHSYYYESTRLPIQPELIQCSPIIKKQIRKTEVSHLKILESNTIVVSRTNAPFIETDSAEMKMISPVYNINIAPDIPIKMAFKRIKSNDLYLLSYECINISGTLIQHIKKQQEITEMSIMQPIVHIHTEKVSDKIKTHVNKDAKHSLSLYNRVSTQVKTLNINIDLTKSSKMNQVVCQYRNSESYSVRNSCKKTLKNKFVNFDDKTKNTTFSKPENLKLLLEQSDYITRDSCTKEDTIHNEPEAVLSEPIEIENLDVSKSKVSNKFINKNKNVLKESTHNNKVAGESKSGRVTKMHCKNDSIGREMIEPKGDINIHVEIPDVILKKVRIHKKSQSKEINCSIGRNFHKTQDSKSKENSSINSPYAFAKYLQMDEKNHIKDIHQSSYAFQRLKRFQQIQAKKM